MLNTVQTANTATIENQMVVPRIDLGAATELAESPDATDLAITVTKLVFAMTPHDLQQVVDQSDFKFGSDASYLPNWRAAVIDAITVGINDDADWALEYVR